ncbi:hypothetical protein BGZ97_006640 [Linnemannia gamsii]|uniref:Uncharacterized protein n=1 Tax=Linnemannia gamsii TaxID=64522 RepID=A0A9P6QPH4_9FUNG|nr:hypothetical protein BGZ97_006640 [Linnemannia gamsii]
MILVVCSTIVLGAESYEILLKNNAGNSMVLVAGSDQRTCFCLVNTQTASIKGQNGGDIKLFSSDNCNGNYQSLGPNDTAYNAQWVNSASWGKSGIPSTDGYLDGQRCPNVFA